MARIFIDGFESGTFDLWDFIEPSLSISTGITGMDGTYCVGITTGFLTKDITATNTIYGSVLITTTGAIMDIIFYNGSQVMVEFKRNAVTGYVEAYRGTTLVATGSISLSNNYVHLIEFYIYIDDAVGRIQVKINGINDTLDFTGDTKPSTETTITRFTLDNLFTAYNMYYDNIVLDDANWIGNTKIQAIVPNGAGTTTQWTPSAGANYTCVDEIPPVDTDWIETNTINLTDTYTASNLTGVIDNIKCVQVQARSMKEGAPTPLNIDLVVRSDGTDYPSADKAVQSTFYKSLFAIWETDPATAAAWLEAAVNAAEIGIKSKT